MYAYLYSNGIITKHRKLINNKSILKEAKGANGLSIYKCDEYEFEQLILNNIISGKYITSILLK